MRARPARGIICIQSQSLQRRTSAVAVVRIACNGDFIIVSIEVGEPPGFTAPVGPASSMALKRFPGKHQT